MARRAGVLKRDRSNLGLALDHVWLASHGPAVFAPYSLFTAGWLTGYDGVVAAGFRVAETMLGIAPHTETFRFAVHRAGTPFSISVMSDGTLIIRGDDFKANVPGTSPDAIPNVQPDMPSVEVNEHWRNAMCAVADVTKAREQRVVGSAVHMRERSVVGTNGTTVLEGHHGCNLPRAAIVPREFVDALSKVKYLPTSAGFGEDTFTVWFGTNCWLRTNLFKDVSYPDTDVIFAQQISAVGEMRPIPSNTLLACETLKPFIGDALRLDAQGFVTETGARYTFEHFMLADRVVPYEGVRYAATHGQYIGFNDSAMYWYGQQLRGISVAPK
jgi:hypothetical protein